MIQAQARGVIDFSQACVDDVKWYIRRNWLLEEMDREHRARLTETRHRLDVAGINPLLNEKNLNELYDGARNRQNVLEKLLRPWVAEKEEINTSKTEIKQGIAAWEQKYGSLSDPSTQAKINRTVATMRQTNRDRAR